MRTAPRGLRKVIGFFGRRNTGKSSLLNALSRQKVALVSDIPGTTTDPVERSMELLPIGPVVLVDTAGLDDDSALGKDRIAATRRVIRKTDLAVLVAEAGNWGTFENAWLEELRSLCIPLVIVLNKHDKALNAPLPSALKGITHNENNEKTSNIAWVYAEANVGDVDEVRKAILHVAPSEWIEEVPLIRDLIEDSGPVILVVPVDNEAPKGRLILPQVQAIRDLLDGGIMSLVVRESELEEALSVLKRPPSMVITDSQAFKKVAAIVPESVPLTGFSIFFARAKGDLDTFTKGAARIFSLTPGDRVLIAESCTHHAVDDDIGRVKIPRWLSKKVGGALEIHHAQGKDFPDDLASYRLVIHCGSCMTTRKEMLSRMDITLAAGVPITNYGVAIAACLGLLDRALRPFPSAWKAFQESIQEDKRRTSE